MAKLPNMRKIVVLGSPSVGKSSLVLQFVQNEFSELYYPTIKSSFVKNISYNGNDYECEIIDTPGHDEYTPLNPAHVIGIHGYLLVYSVTSHGSFAMIENIRSKLLEYSGLADIPCVIVGSQCDLRTRRQVDKLEGQKLARDIGCAFEETSAKENINVAADSDFEASAFNLCLAEIERHANFNRGTQVQAPKTRTCLIM